jgi:Spt4/RpoE2 zinc finger
MSDENERDMEEEEEEEQLPQQVADLAEASVPNRLRGIRACKRCGILKTLDQFINEGCENCPFLDMVSFCTHLGIHAALLLLFEN